MCCNGGHWEAAFNLGTYAIGISALIGIVHLIGGTPGTVTVAVLVGVIVGTVAFTAANLCCLAQILAVIGGVSPWQVMRSQARLSAYMAVGAVATGLPTTVIGLRAPLLLPFMAMPALAVTYAYRAAAQESDERARSTVLFQLSHAHAERDDRDDVVRRFLVIVRRRSAADLAMVVLDDATEALAVDADTPDEMYRGPVPDQLRSIRQLPEPTFIADDLPADPTAHDRGPAGGRWAHLRAAPRRPGPPARAAVRRKSHGAGRAG